MFSVPSNEDVDEVIRQKKAAVLAGETARQREQRKTTEVYKRKHLFSVSYAARLTGAFALTALMTALIAASILAVVWEGEFQNYTRENMETIAAKTASQIASRYKTEGAFTPSVLNTVATASSTYEGIAIQVLNAQNTTVYDDTWGDNQSQDAPTSLSLAPAREQTVSAPIVVNDETVGTVRIWSFSSNALLTQNDIEFRSSSYKAIVLAAFVAVTLALIVGLIAARGLVDPIKRITETAVSVKGGNLSARTGIVGSDEIAQLGETFDEMADSIQRDRELERRLTTDVAHELRTPLMGIQATVEAIIDGVFQADEERLAAINSETMRLKRLVEALLNLSRLETGSVRFNEEVLDLSELIASLVVSHEALLEAAELGFVYEFDDDVFIDGDADLIRQATANLISNAVRYNEPGGKVVVAVRKHEGMASISVLDTGIGISKEDQEHVFSRFWRADEGRDRARGGLGVGLAVVKEIVDYHKGSIEIDSELGKGTKFTLFIPLHVDAPAKPLKGREKKVRVKKTTEALATNNKD